MAWRMLRTGILLVRVRPCVTTGSPSSPSQTSTASEKVVSAETGQEERRRTLDASTTLLERSNVALDGTLTLKLTADEVGLHR